MNRLKAPKGVPISTDITLFRSSDGVILPSPSNTNAVAVEQSFCNIPRRFKYLLPVRRIRKRLESVNGLHELISMIVPVSQMTYLELAVALEPISVIEVALAVGGVVSLADSGSMMLVDVRTEVKAVGLAKIGLLCSSDEKPGLSSVAVSASKTVGLVCVELVEPELVNPPPARGSSVLERAPLDFGSSVLEASPPARGSYVPDTPSLGRDSSEVEIAPSAPGLNALENVADSFP